jgi:hypothetical protein
VSIALAKPERAKKALLIIEVNNSFFGFFVKQIKITRIRPY